MIPSQMKKKFGFSYRIIIFLTILSFSLSLSILPSEAHGQSAINLPPPGTIVSVSPSFNPAIIKGITLYAKNPLKLDFIIAPGDDNLKNKQLQNEANKLIKYFMASLTIPEDEMWVNLSPYEKDRIIAKGLSQTDLGRDMLSQDYILKQLSASLMYPEKKLGEQFWEKVYTKSQEKYGTSDIPINTFNKVWIVPEKANVYIHENNVFVVDNYLKVMLEEDYLALENNFGHNRHGVGKVSKHQRKKINDVSSEIMREVIIPAIEKEVNEGKNFANLKQIFNSMILATWYKQNLKESLLATVYINQNKIDGIQVKEKKIKEKIYQKYIEAFQRGAYNYIKDDYDHVTKKVIPRQYFSGGILGIKNKVGQLKRAAVQTEILNGDESKISVEFSAIEHQALHQEAEIRETLERRFKRQQLESGKKEESSIDEEIRQAKLYNQDLVVKPNYVTEDGISVYIDQFNFNHAGRDRRSVYARSRKDVDHKLRELRLWENFIIKQGILTAEEVTAGRSGTAFIDWVNNAPDSKTKFDRQKISARTYYEILVESLKRDRRDKEAARIEENIKELVDSFEPLDKIDFDFFIAGPGPRDLPRQDGHAIPENGTLFLLERHADVIKYVKLLAARFAEANIIMFEDFGIQDGRDTPSAPSASEEEVFAKTEEYYNRILHGEMTAAEAIQSAEQKGVFLDTDYRVPPILEALEQAHKSDPEASKSKRVLIAVNKNNENVVAMHQHITFKKGLKDQALSKGKIEEALQEYKSEVKKTARWLAMRDQGRFDQFREVRQKHANAKILISAGRDHPLALYLSTLQPGEATAIEMLGGRTGIPIYTLHDALVNRFYMEHLEISFDGNRHEEFGILPTTPVDREPTEAEWIQAFTADLLRRQLADASEDDSNFMLLNETALKVNNMGQLRTLGQMLHILPNIKYHERKTIFIAWLVMVRAWEWDTASAVLLENQEAGEEGGRLSEHLPIKSLSTALPATEIITGLEPYHGVNLIDVEWSDFKGSDIDKRIFFVAGLARSLGQIHASGQVHGRLVRKSLGEDKSYLREDIIFVEITQDGQFKVNLPNLQWLGPNPGNRQEQESEAKEIKKLLIQKYAQRTRWDERSSEIAQEIEEVFDESYSASRGDLKAIGNVTYPTVARDSSQGLPLKTDEHYETLSRELFDQQVRSGRLKSGNAWEKPQLAMEDELAFIIGNKNPQTLTLVDLGAGEGMGGSLHLVKQGFKRVIHTDISIEAKSVFEERLAQIATPDEIDRTEYKVGDMLKILESLPDNSVDIFHVHLSAHYFSYDKTKKIFSEMRRVSKDDGTAIIKAFSTQDSRITQGQLYRVNDQGYFYEVAQDGKPTRLFSAQDLKDILEYAGFDNYEGKRITVPGWAQNRPWVLIAGGNVGLFGSSAEIAKDEAMVSNKKTGGIDLNANNLNLKIHGDKFKKMFKANPNILKNININGFLPTIMGIAPISIPMLLGGKNTSPSTITVSHLTQ